MNTPIQIVLPRAPGGPHRDRTVRADIPPIRVGDPAWVHEAAKAIALSITEHYDTKE